MRLFKNCAVPQEIAMEVGIRLQEINSPRRPSEIIAERDEMICNFYYLLNPDYLIEEDTIWRR